MTMSNRRQWRAGSRGGLAAPRTNRGRSSSGQMEARRPVHQAPRPGDTSALGVEGRIGSVPLPGGGDGGGVVGGALFGAIGFVGVAGLAGEELEG